MQRKASKIPFMCSRTFLRRKFSQSQAATQPWLSFRSPDSSNLSEAIFRGSQSLANNQTGSSVDVFYSTYTSMKGLSLVLSKGCRVFHNGPVGSFTRCSYICRVHSSQGINSSFELVHSWLIRDGTQSDNWQLCPFYSQWKTP